MILPSEIALLAARFQRFGALHQAQELYRQALQHQPDDAELLARLGRVCHTLGHHDEAVTSFRRALALRPDWNELRNDLGVALMEQGRLDDAISSFSKAIELQSDYTEAHNNLGIALMRQGDPHGAAACYRRALVLKPDDHAASCNLGNALAVLGEHREAVDSFRQAVQHQPDFAQAWLNLGHALRSIGQRDDAAICYERAAQLRPDDPDPFGELGTLLMQRGELGEAVARFERALRLRPDFAEVYNNLGLALMGQGHVEEARLSFEQALYLRPDLAEVYNNLGLALLNQDRGDEARQSFEQALALRPEMADAHNNLALALAAKGRSDDALDCYERALRIDPHHLGALTNLGNAYKDQGRAAEAIECYRNVLEVKPDDAKVHSNLLLAKQYQPGADPQEILDEARGYARRHVDLLAGVCEPHPVRPLAGRRLRIGYVSPDYREHPVVYFLEPILAAHDHQQFEIICYADVSQPDATTRRLQHHADRWRSLVGLSDARAAEVIRQDDVDILVDLAGHTAHNRLPSFAHKPAPIQVSYLGYLGTTGLAVMDYYLTDAHADPVGLAEPYYQEQLIRLPECGFCYLPGPAPEVSPELAARQSGQVTFGCLNNLAKVSEEVLALWSRVLASVPGSRLLLRTGAGRCAEDRIRDILARRGISPARLLLAGRTATRSDYLKLYHVVDIGLDPVPYNGVTTTCDALWMGVPVISLAGRMGVSRQGVRFLRTVGLDELVADTPEDYVRIATDLAGDLRRLASMHTDLRKQMSRSPLMDAKRLTRNLEAAYRGMWDAMMALR